MSDELRLDPLSRRDLLRQGGFSVLAASSLASVISACGGIERERQAATTTAKHAKQPISELTVANWPFYIDRSVLRRFDKRYGAQITYTEEVNDNEEFFGKLRQQLERGRPTGRDIVVITDYMAARWIRLGFAEPIDKANVPNASNLVENLRDPAWDRGRRFSLPWQSFMVGIAVDRRRVGAIDDVRELFDPKLEGRASLFSDWRDTAGLLLLSEGVKPEDATIDDVKAAIDVVRKQLDAGQLRRFTGNDYTTDLAKGNVWASMAYSGDILQLQQDQPHLEFIVPNAGALLPTDNMVMPAKVENPYAAETFMNFIYEPEIAAILAGLGYVSPVDGAADVLRRTKPKLADNELIFPSTELRERLHAHPALSVEEEEEATIAFQELIGA